MVSRPALIRPRDRPTPAAGRWCARGSGPAAQQAVAGQLGDQLPGGAAIE